MRPWLRHFPLGNGQGATLCPRCGLMSRQPGTFDRTPCVAAAWPNAAILAVRRGAFDVPLATAPDWARAAAERAGWVPLLAG